MESVETRKSLHFLKVGTVMPEEQEVFVRLSSFDPKSARARVTGCRIGADRADDFPAYFLVERSIAPHRAVVVASTISRGGTVTDCPHAIVERARVRRASRCAAPRGHCRCIFQKNQLADATPGRKISIDAIELQGLGYSCLSSSRTS